jgi:NAD(P)-dependent dehydrogenase (short-subunit alcohol dehydrogenase family)
MNVDVNGPLAGRTAIVTGAARGLGREYALMLASLGANVVVNDLSGAEKVVSEIRAARGQAAAHEGNIAGWSVAREMIETAISGFGGLDVLVNNAGMLRVSHVLDLSEEDWDNMLAANLTATVAPIRAAMTYWARESRAGRQRRASLINTTSETALVGHPGRAAYGAGKAGVATLTLSLAVELEEIGVRVNAVAPRARTEMSQQTAHVRAMMEKTGGGKLDSWDPAHVAPLVAYLALPDCTVTGEVFQAAGGEVTRFTTWHRAAGMTTDQPWTLEDMRNGIPKLLGDGDDAAVIEKKRSLMAALR